LLATTIMTALRSDPAQEAAHNSRTTPGQKKVSPPRRKNCLVDRVIDGDTVKANCEGRGVITIRQIGIDTPELARGRHPAECYADRAKAEAERLMPHDEAIQIVQDTSQAPVDKYGRTLAYILFRPGDISGGMDWGLWAVQWGYAKEYTYDKPYAQQQAYRDAQSKADKDSLGMWGACTW
jgi:micrococcal nuclease